MLLCTSAGAAEYSPSGDCLGLSRKLLWICWKKHEHNGNKTLLTKDWISETFWALCWCPNSHTWTKSASLCGTPARHIRASIPSLVWNGGIEKQNKQTKKMIPRKIYIFLIRNAHLEVCKLKKMKKIWNLAHLSQAWIWQILRFWDLGIIFINSGFPFYFLIIFLRELSNFILVLCINLFIINSFWVLIFLKFSFCGHCDIVK